MRTCWSNAPSSGAQPDLVNRDDGPVPEAGMSPIGWSADLQRRLIAGGQRPSADRGAVEMLAAMLTQAIALGIFFFEVWHPPGGQENWIINPRIRQLPHRGQPCGRPGRANDPGNSVADRRATRAGAMTLASNSKAWPGRSAMKECSARRPTTVQRLRSSASTLPGVRPLPRLALDKEMQETAGIAQVPVLEVGLRPALASRGSTSPNNPAGVTARVEG